MSNDYDSISVNIAVNLKVVSYRYISVILE